MATKVSIKWSNFENTIKKAVAALYKFKHFHDIVILCENVEIKAHKFVLANCCEYFETIFHESPTLEKIELPNSIGLKEFVYLLEYFYYGETIIKDDEVRELVQISEVLKVRGIAIPFDDYISEDKINFPNQIKVKNEEDYMAQFDSAALTNSEETTSNDNLAKKQNEPNHTNSFNTTETCIKSPNNNSNTYHNVNPIQISEVHSIKMIKAKLNKKDRRFDSFTNISKPNIVPSKVLVKDSSLQMGYTLNESIKVEPPFELNIDEEVEYRLVIDEYKSSSSSSSQSPNTDKDTNSHLSENTSNGLPSIKKRKIQTISAQDVATMDLGGKASDNRVIKYTDNSYSTSSNIISNVQIPNTAVVGEPTLQKETATTIQMDTTSNDTSNSSKIDMCSAAASDSYLEYVMNESSLSLEESGKYQKIFSECQKLRTIEDIVFMEQFPLVSIHSQKNRTHGVKYVAADNCLTTKWMTRIPVSVSRLKHNHTVAVLMRYNDLDCWNQPVNMCASDRDNRNHEDRSTCFCAHIHSPANYCIIPQGEDRVLWRTTDNPIALIDATRDRVLFHIAFICRNSCLSIRHVNLEIQVYEGTSYLWSTSIPIRVCASPLRDHYTYMVKSGESKPKTKKEKKLRESFEIQNKKFFKFVPPSTPGVCWILFRIHDLEKEICIVNLIKLMGGVIHRERIMFGEDMKDDKNLVHVE